MIALVALNGVAALLALMSLQVVENWAAAAALVLLVFHVFVALGLLRLMPWARRALIGYAALGLLGICAFIAYSLLDQRGGPWSRADGRIWLAGAVFAALCLWLLFYLRRPDVKELFD